MYAPANTERGCKNGTYQLKGPQSRNRSYATDLGKARSDLSCTARQAVNEWRMTWKEGLAMKSWNIRDQPKESLERQLTKKYKEIDSNYKMLRRVSNIEDAKMLIDEIWQMKSFAKTIELELMRREYENGTAS